MSEKKTEPELTQEADPIQDKKEQELKSLPLETNIGQTKAPADLNQLPGIAFPIDSHLLNDDDLQNVSDESFNLLGPVDALKFEQVIVINRV